MRKLSLFLAFALLMTASAFAQYGVISVDPVATEYMGGLGTPDAGKVHVIPINYDVTDPNLNNPSADWTGSNGYEMYSPDGADWGYMSVTFGPIVDALPLSVVKYSYHYELVGTAWSRTSNNGADPCPGAGVVDRAGYYLAIVDFTGAGYPEGTDGIALNFEFTTQFADVGLTMCFDTLDAITAWEWAAGSMGDFPLWDNGLGASEPRCWEIIYLPNVAPVWCDDPPEDAISFNHCAQGSYQLCATDPDPEMSGGVVTYSLAPGFDDGSFGEVTPQGFWTWSGTSVPQVGGVDIEFVANDSQADSDDNFVLHVTTTNIAPTIECPPGSVTISAGTSKTITVAPADVDVCDILIVTADIAAPYGGDYVTVSGNDVTFFPEFLPETIGHDVTVDVTVSDGDLTAVCQLEFTVIVGSPYQVELEKKQDQLQGHFADVFIKLHKIDKNAGFGGFDFLVAYDASALAFQLAYEGDIYDDCGWEYFTYRFGGYGNCGNACPSGMLRVIGLAEQNDGPNHPGCDTPDAGFVQEGQLPIVLTYLRFLVSNDRTLECQYVPIRFFWYDCGDNVLSNHDGSEAYLSAKVFDFFEYGDPFVGGEITGVDLFPTYQGAQEECIYVNEDLGKVAMRNVDFQNGGIDIVCAEDIDARGDINLNGLAYEIADAVMFTNYFINGLSAFGTHDEGSIAASDVNADGIALSVADLVYLVRVVIGDAAPYDKVAPVAANITYGNDRFNVDVEMGAAHIVMEGNVTPTLLADNMEMLYANNGQTTSILVYSTEANQSFRGDFLQVNGSIVSTEFATFTGARVAAKVLPSTFVVEQNYPNPFNPSTTFKFEIPNAGEWTLGIYNITGQLVESMSGVSETGYESVVWDASDLSSGIYFYKVSTGTQSVTKKAVLLK